MQSRCSPKCCQHQHTRRHTRRLTICSADDRAPASTHPAGPARNDFSLRFSFALPEIHEPLQSFSVQSPLVQATTALIQLLFCSRTHGVFRGGQNRYFSSTIEPAPGSSRREPRPLGQEATETKKERKKERAEEEANACAQEADRIEEGWVTREGKPAAKGGQGPKKKRRKAWNCDILSVRTESARSDSEEPASASCVSGQASKASNNATSHRGVGGDGGCFSCLSFLFMCLSAMFSPHACCIVVSIVFSCDGGVPPAGAQKR